MKCLSCVVGCKLRFAYFASSRLWLLLTDQSLGRNPSVIVSEDRNRRKYEQLRERKNKKTRPCERVPDGLRKAWCYWCTGATSVSFPIIHSYHLLPPRTCCSIKIHRKIGKSEKHKSTAVNRSSHSRLLVIQAVPTQNY